MRRPPKFPKASDEERARAAQGGTPKQGLALHTRPSVVQRLQCAEGDQQWGAEKGSFRGCDAT
jgi:hypothetical protein